MNYFFDLIPCRFVLGMLFGASDNDNMMLDKKDDSGHSGSNNDEDNTLLNEVTNDSTISAEDRAKRIFTKLFTTDINKVIEVSHVFFIFLHGILYTGFVGFVQFLSSCDIF